MAFQRDNVFSDFLRQTARKPAVAESAPAVNFLLDERVPEERETVFLAGGPTATGSGWDSDSWLRTFGNHFASGDGLDFKSELLHFRIDYKLEDFWMLGEIKDTIDEPQLAAARRRHFEILERDCKIGLAFALTDLGELDRAEALFQEALALDGHNERGRWGLAEVWFIKSAKSHDIALFDRSKALLQQLADEGIEDADSRLHKFRQKWELAVERRGVRYRELFGEDLEDTVQELRETPTRTTQEMSAAERLGRAMIALWQAERTPQPERRNHLCVHAQQLLDVSDAEAGELLTGFVETRGLVLLAKDDATSALNYFNEQIKRYGRGGWFGVRLGEQRARLKAGQTVDFFADEGPFGSRSTRFSIQVANVIQRLTKDEAEQEVGDILRNLYPNAASLAEQWSKASEESASNPADTSIFAGGMIAAFIRSRWFRAAGVSSAEDLAKVENRGRVIAEIRRTQNDTFDVLASAAVSFAA